MMGPGMSRTAALPNVNWIQLERRAQRVRVRATGGRSGSVRLCRMEPRT